MTFSENFKENAYKRDAPLALLTLLRVTYLENNGTTTFAYYCDDNVAIDSNVSGSNQVYQPAMFRISLGDNDKESNADVTLDFDSGDVQLIRKLQDLNHRPEVTIWAVLSNDLNTPEVGPIGYETKDFTVSKSNVSMKLEVEPILNEPIPGNKFTPKLFPGLWQNIQ